MWSWLPFLLTLPAFTVADAPTDIVRRSVVSMTADWKAEPSYSYRQREVEEKFGAKHAPTSKTVVTYEVTMMDGSEYRKAIARNDEPLPAGEQADQQARFEAERNRRRHESPSERARRIQKYNNQRAEEEKMLLELAAAFDFKLLGEETVAGHKAWVLDATPKPGYRPVREAKVLTGMRGKLWIDQAGYHWVKVEAEVTRSVSFLLGLATVVPGTEFLLEQAPVGDGVWLPSHFVNRVTANVLWGHRKTLEEETYSAYRATAGAGSGGR